jgi:hypothetical protein
MRHLDEGREHAARHTAVRRAVVEAFPNGVRQRGDEVAVELAGEVQQHLLRGCFGAEAVDGFDVHVAALTRGNRWR